MKKHLLWTTLLIVTLLSSTNAQVYEKKTVHSGESISAISYYLFPSFEDAAVKLKNGGTLLSKMNFNLLICQIQFINEHGDTLNIAKPADIETITFDSSLFFYNEGYYQICSPNDAVKFAVLRQVSYVPVKIDALGLKDRTGTGVESSTSFFTKSELKDLLMDEDVDINKKTSYFLTTDNKEMIKATKSAFIKLFSENRDRIQTYLKESKTDFNKEGDLKKLYNFCTSLQ